MYVLGLRELVSKSGKDTLPCLKEILADIETSVIHSDLVAKKNLVQHLLRPSVTRQVQRKTTK